MSILSERNENFEGNMKMKNWVNLKKSIFLSIYTMYLSVTIRDSGKLYINNVKVLPSTF